MTFGDFLWLSMIIGDFLVIKYGDLSYLRMYCIDMAGVSETHDAHAFHW